MRTERNPIGLRVVAGLDMAPTAAPYRPARCRRTDQPTTPTAENSRIRLLRRAVWWRAESVTQYWQALLNLELATDRLDRNHSKISGLLLIPYSRETILDKWRECLSRQMLTPAHDLNSLKWKRETLAKGNYLYTGVTPERLERAIADDAAWLAAHPTKRTDSEEAVRRREHKEAMRRRIREVAASRNLSDADIEPVLTLKHQEIARFSERHGVNLDWLFEGGSAPPFSGCEPVNILDGNR